MDRPRIRWVRSFLIVAGGAGLTFFALGIPASAANPVSGKISAGVSGLSVRTGPTTLAPRVTTLRTGTTVTIECQVTGPRIAGRVRTTNLWDRLSTGTYVSDSYVIRPGGVGSCPSSAPSTSGATQITPSAPATANTAPAPTGDWINPVAPYRTVQGFRTLARPTHQGEDFMAKRDHPIRAAASGVVVTVKCNASTNNCDVDGGTSTTGCGWYVEIKHAGGLATRYCHMIRRPPVVVGQAVTVGQVIGNVGSSGNSSGSHLHYEVHSGYPAVTANAVDPIAFMLRAGVKIT